MGTYYMYMCSTIAIELYSRTEFAVLTNFKDSFVFRACSVDEYMAKYITQWVYLHKWFVFGYQQNVIRLCNGN